LHPGNGTRFYNSGHAVHAYDSKDVSELRFLPIPGTDNQMCYCCKTADIGRRVRVTLRPLSMIGQVGDELAAVSEEVLCSFPAFLGASLCNNLGHSIRTSHRADLAVKTLKDPDPEMLSNPVLGDDLTLSLKYIGGEPGGHSIRCLSRPCLLQHKKPGATAS
jgi:hypothetical protein